MKLFIGFAVVFVLFVVFGAVLLIASLIPVTRSETASDSPSILPEDLAIRLVDDGDRIELTWSEVEAESVTFVVQRSEAGSDDDWEDVASFDSSSPTYSYTEPRTEVNYIYRLYVFDDEGSAGYTPVVNLD
jgi:hypothetical protein